MRTELILSNKTPEELFGDRMSLDEELEYLFKPLTMELDRLIIGTVPHRHGGFSFSPHLDSEENVWYLLADQQWERLYGHKIRSLCKLYNLGVNFDPTKGMFDVYPISQHKKRLVPTEYNGKLWIERIRRSKIARAKRRKEIYG